MRRHPFLDRVRKLLTHVEGERPRRRPRADFHTDQMPMAPPYRGPDPGRAPVDDSSSSAEQPKND